MALNLLYQGGERCAAVENQAVRVSERVLARGVFGPLGGIVETGAVAAGHLEPRRLVGGRLGERLPVPGGPALELVRDIGDFSPSTMRIADELGYMREHQVTAPCAG